MTKTEIEIERDFTDMVQNSALGQAIRGGIYRSEMRPYDSKEEDLIIVFLSGLDSQVQTGVVIFNLYVPDVAFEKGRMVPDKKRIGVLQGLIRDFVESQGGTEYWLETDGTPTTSKNEELEQHFIYARIKFQRLTTDEI